MAGKFAGFWARPLGAACCVLLATGCSLFATVEHTESDTCTLAASCADLLGAQPVPSTGMATIYPDGATATSVYCEMAADGGGWTRVVRFDAAVDACPGNWVASSQVVGCVRDLPGSGLRTAFFTPPLPEYGEVRGYT